MGGRFRPCDECVNFTFWHSMYEEAPDWLNPCDLGHTMSFKLPESPTDVSWGFFRKVCKDRVARDAPHQPAPHETPDAAGQRDMAAAWAADTRAELSRLKGEE